MKRTILAVTMAVGTSLFIMPLTSEAHDGQWDKNHHYYVDKHGYWDAHDHYQKFILWHGHHGYWDERGDKRIFIQVG
jgi:hypothetical protein